MSEEENKPRLSLKNIFKVKPKGENETDWEKLVRVTNEEKEASKNQQQKETPHKDTEEKTPNP